MRSPKQTLLPLAALMAFMPVLSIEASPAEAAARPNSPPAPMMAPAPKAEPYGWWYSKSAAPFSRGSGIGHGQGAQPPAGHSAGARPSAAADQAAASAPGGKPPDAAQARGNIPGGRSVARNRSPIQSLYLAVVGADRPEMAPEAYYRFTARKRQGGVALGSSWHKAEAVLDGDRWRADFIGTSFGTVEVYSRFKLGERYVYSQHNFLHFIRSEDAEGVEMPERLEGPPADWPQFVFPVSYNDMPFRSAQVGSTVDFQLQIPQVLSAPAEGFLLEENMPDTVNLGYSARSKKFSLSPREDLRLLEGGGRDRRASKMALVLIELPGSRDVMTFAMSVNRSRWSTRKLGLGLLVAAAAAGITAIVVIRRRGSFKYNDLD